MKRVSIIFCRLLKREQPITLVDIFCLLVEKKRYKTDQPQLKDVYLAAEQVVSGGDSFIDAACAQATLHVPAVLLDSYKADNAWKRFSNIVAIAGGELTGVASVSVQPVNDATPYYNISGQHISPNAKGIIIHNGKKTTQK